RARVRDRENLRFERTRVFGVVRRIFLALGAGLAREGRLAETRDVFYLAMDEVFAASEAPGNQVDLRAKVASRREEFARYAREPPPPDRFETFGTVADRAPIAAAAAAPGAGGAQELHGTGCCPGRVRGRVRVVRDPRAAQDLAGHILVAERTDPGWTVLFPV